MLLLLSAGGTAQGARANQRAGAAQREPRGRRQDEAGLRAVRDVTRQTVLRPHPPFPRSTPGEGRVVDLVDSVFGGLVNNLCNKIQCTRTIRPCS